MQFLTEQFGWEFRVCMQPTLPQPSAHFLMRIGHEPGVVKFLTELKRHYYERMIIIDGFNTDHPSRRAFYRNTLGSHEAWIRHHSKLRANNCGMALTYILMILTLCDQLDVHIPLDPQPIEQLLQEGQQYHTLEIDEKIAYAQRVDRHIHELFSLIAQEQM